MTTRPLSIVIGITGILSLILAVGVFKVSQDALAREVDECQIYKLLFANHYEDYVKDMLQYSHKQPDTNAHFVVEQQTSIEMIYLKHPLDTTSYESYMRNRGKSIDISDVSIIDDFMRMNEKKCWLNKDIVASMAESKMNITLIRPKRFPAYMQVDPGAYWVGFYRKYPAAIGLFSVSRVGFNRTRDAGMVYFVCKTGPLSAGGDVVHVKKNNGQWTIIKKAWVWMS